MMGSGGGGSTGGAGGGIIYISVVDSLDMNGGVRTVSIFVRVCAGGDNEKVMVLSFSCAWLPQIIAANGQGGLKPLKSSGQGSGGWTLAQAAAVTHTACVWRERGGELFLMGLLACLCGCVPRGTVAGGGGSGGAVRLEFGQLTSQSSSVSARGGIGGGTAGGGGGGIVSMFWSSPRPNATITQTETLNVDVSGGSSLFPRGYGFPGSKMALPPCGPGE